MKAIFKGCAQFAFLVTVFSLAVFGSTRVLSVSPSSLTFATQAINTTSQQAFIASNQGTGTLRIQTVTVSGSGAFRVIGWNGGSVALAPKASLTLQVAFTPTAAGTFTGTVTTTGNG